MTFCLGIKVKDGLVGIADSRVISGNENISGRKISVYQHEGHSFFLMTSGLRSVRDKAVAYFEESLEEQDVPYDRFFKVVNALAGEIRRVAAEDKKALEDSGLKFNIFCLMGGKMINDNEHRLYLIYPEANWVEIGHGTPYHIIGASGYGQERDRRQGAEAGFDHYLVKPMSMEIVRDILERQLDGRAHREAHR